MRAEWRSVWRGSGGPCVTACLGEKRQWWYAGRVDLEQQVVMCFTISCVLYSINCHIVTNSRVYYKGVMSCSTSPIHGGSSKIQTLCHMTQVLLKWKVTVMERLTGY